MRKRRSKKEKVFTVPIQFYVTPKQKGKLDRTAEKAGITLSECLRRMIDKLKISEKPPIEFPKMIVELRRIGTNLNQIARALNANGHFIPEDFSSVIDRLNETEDKLYEAFTPGKGG